ncbi:excisionase family DNA binding protein [Dyadobacter jejuensis]|uniref:Excisionase family DNA binding protein n=1 Tax=Dyadobacter jejuensis TaxID=1082580 RepID=A0A316ABS6_9BACT|nr:helix-turn-helix domain-containing protein [Dyadobacter jejuensis]PWJ55071.1 excisionase family DNA binding protein [Dyadobacter jejuensis]
MNTTIALSLPPEQVELLEIVRTQNERILAYQNQSTYLTEPEACERLKVSLTTIRQWRKDGWLRYFAEGANIRYRADYLDADFEARSLVNATMAPIIKKQLRSNY